MAAIILLCGLVVTSCSLLLNSQERKMVGKWHEKIQDKEDFVVCYLESMDEYKEDKTMSSSGNITFQYNIGTDDDNFIVYASFDFEEEGTWHIEEDKLISKSDVVNLSDVSITSSTELDAAYISELKKSIKQELPSIRDELLKKDTTEIILLNDTEFKYKDDDGTVYTMTKVK